MKRKLLLALMVAVLTLSFVMPAGAATTKWTTDDFTWKNILTYLDDTMSYGVVAEEYTQGGHSEANVYVDWLNKTSADPI